MLDCETRKNNRLGVTFSMDDDDEKILPGEPGEAPSSGRRPSDSPSPLDEAGMSSGGAGGDDAQVTSASQERLNISPNESRNSQKSPFCAASSTGGASTPSDAGSAGRPGSGSGGETIVIGSSASSSQSSASTTPTASTPGRNFLHILSKPLKTHPFIIC